MEEKKEYYLFQQNGYLHLIQKHGIIKQQVHI